MPQPTLGEELAREVDGADILAPYRERITASVGRRLLDGRSGYVILPTLNDRSVFISDAIDTALARGPVLVLQSTDERIRKNLDAFSRPRATMPATSISHESPSDPTIAVRTDDTGQHHLDSGLAGNVAFATYVAFSLAAGDPNRQALFGRFGTVILDDCQRAVADDTAAALRLIKAPLIGFTTNPVRGDGKALSPVFGEGSDTAIIDQMTLSEAQAIGATVPGRVIFGRQRFQELIGTQANATLAAAFTSALAAGRHSADASRIALTTAFQSGPAFAPAIGAATARLWQENAAGRRLTVIHSETKLHAEAITAAFTALRTPTRSVRVGMLVGREAIGHDGPNPIDFGGPKYARRGALLEAAKRGDFDVLVTAGSIVDLPRADTTMLAFESRGLATWLNLATRAQVAYTPGPNEEPKRDHLIIDLGSTLTQIVHRDPRYSSADISADAVTRFETATNHQRAALEALGATQAIVEAEVHKQRDAERARLSRREPNIDVTTARVLADRLAASATEQHERSIDLRAVTDRTTHPAPARPIPPPIVKIDDGLWLAGPTEKGMAVILSAPKAADLFVATSLRDKFLKDQQSKGLFIAIISERENVKAVFRAEHAHDVPDLLVSRGISLRPGDRASIRAQRLAPVNDTERAAVITSRQRLVTTGHLITDQHALNLAKVAIRLRYEIGRRLAVETRHGQSFLPQDRIDGARFLGIVDPAGKYDRIALDRYVRDAWAAGIRAVKFIGPTSPSTDRHIGDATTSRQMKYLGADEKILLPDADLTKLASAVRDGRVLLVGEPTAIRTLLSRAIVEPPPRAAEITHKRTDRDR